MKTIAVSPTVARGRAFSAGVSVAPAAACTASVASALATALATASTLLASWLAVVVVVVVVVVVRPGLVVRLGLDNTQQQQLHLLHLLQHGRLSRVG